MSKYVFYAILGGVFVTYWQKYKPLEIVAEQHPLYGRPGHVNRPRDPVNTAFPTYNIYRHPETHKVDSQFTLLNSEKYHNMYRSIQNVNIMDFVPLEMDTLRSTVRNTGVATTWLGRRKNIHTHMTDLGPDHLDKEHTYNTNFLKKIQPVDNIHPFSHLLDNY